MIDSRLMAKRIDDSSSTASASQRRLVFSCSPAVVVFMIWYGNPFFKKQKGQPWPPLPLQFMMLLLYLAFY